MTNKPRTAITPTREENYAEWYQQVIRAACPFKGKPSAQRVVWAKAY